MVDGGSLFGTISTPLSVASGQRIVTRAFEPVFDAADLKPMTLVEGLLEPCATARITYACNVPAIFSEKTSAFRRPPLDRSGMVPSKIERTLDEAFPAGSFPGGQVAAVTRTGEPCTIFFRWACLSAAPSIGAVWRCFFKARDRTSDGDWNAIASDYLFDAGTGSLLTAPSSPLIVLPDGSHLDLDNTAGMPTSLACKAGCVKVIRLAADGWLKRNLVSLVLDPQNRVIARFSDGARMTIGIAAKELNQRSRAA